MYRFIKKTLFSIAGAVLLIGGVFVVIAGAASGFGHTSAMDKLSEVIIGLIAAGIGFYCLYFANGNNLKKTLSDLFSVIFIWWR